MTSALRIHQLRMFRQEYISVPVYTQEHSHSIIELSLSIMAGQLNVSYKNGEVRIVQLHALFFTQDPKKDSTSIAQKAFNLAESFNPKPWKISVTNGGVEKFKKEIVANTPDHILEGRADNESKDSKKAA
jgi:hypothetical protein